MSPKAVRVRTESGWEDLAIQGPPGPPGRSPSCKAQSYLGFAAADTYYRGITLNFATIAFDDFGNSFSPANVWTCRQTGRYLCIASAYGLTASGDIGITMDSGKKMHSARVTRGADGNSWGTECIWIGDYTAGNTLGLAGYHSGGGTGTFIFEAIRLDGPGSGGLSAPFFPAIAGSLARFIPEQTIAFPTNDGSGKSDGVVPLGFTWTTHLAFIIVKCWPLAHWAFYIKGGGWPQSTSQGGIILNNAPAQNFLVTAISIGIP